MSVLTTKPVFAAVHEPRAGPPHHLIAVARHEPNCVYYSVRRKRAPWCFSFNALLIGLPESWCLHDQISSAFDPVCCGHIVSLERNRHTFASRHWYAPYSLRQGRARRRSRKRCRHPHFPWLALCLRGSGCELRCYPPRCLRKRTARHCSQHQHSR